MSLSPSTIKTEYDVLVVGSGVAGLVSALRAHDSGLDVIVLEKADVYGGTTALSGGVMWIPNNPLMTDSDDVDCARRYIKAIMGDEAREDVINAFLQLGPEMVDYLQNLGVKFRPVDYIPDYFTLHPDARKGRSIGPLPFDAKKLGDDLALQRPAHPMWQLFKRYSMDELELQPLSMRLPGWKKILAQIISRYWIDIPWRLKTKRDRRLTLGNSLVAQLRMAMRERDIPIMLNTGLKDLVRADGKVQGGLFQTLSGDLTLSARHGVILASGGFDHDADMRRQHLPFSADPDSSWSPPGNTGDAIKAGMEIGASTDLMDHAFWVPGMRAPTLEDERHVVYHGVFRNPHSICVDHTGNRFADESASYDDFGNAIMWNLRKNGSKARCWMILDAQYREKYAAGVLFPTIMMPDSKIPSEWWDKYVFRANSIGELARKIELDSTVLEASVARFNGFAAKGKDEDFGRGDSGFDRAMGGDPRIAPNPSLAPVSQGPFYALAVELCDLGTKGGLRIGPNAEVLADNGKAIPGLYAAGVNAASIFGTVYPGAGASIGPAATFGFGAASHIAKQRRLNDMAA